MADMERADDFVLVAFVAGAGIDLTDAAAVAYAIAPRDMSIVKLQALLTVGGGTGTGVLTINEGANALTDTLSIDPSAAIGTVTEQDVRVEANNSFAAGDGIEVDVSSVATTAGRVMVNLICRPL